MAAATSPIAGRRSRRTPRHWPRRPRCSETTSGTAITTASTKTDAQLTAKFTDLTTRARAIVTQLKALEPTDSARQKVADLAESLDVGATDLDVITKAATNSDGDAAKTATEKLVADSPAIKTANDALKAELTSSSK